MCYNSEGNGLDRFRRKDPSAILHRWQHSLSALHVATVKGTG